MGDWEEAVDKFQASQEEQKTLAAMQAAALENRAMSLAEGQSLPQPPRHLLEQQQQQHPCAIASYLLKDEAHAYPA